MKSASKNALDFNHRSAASSNSLDAAEHSLNHSFVDARPMIATQRKLSNSMNLGDTTIQRMTNITLERQNIGWASPLANYTYRVGSKAEASLDWNDPRKGTAPETPANDPVHKLNVAHGARSFVRGHLLNARLGGLGIWDNMFPITDEANKKHASGIEATAKEYLIAAKGIDDANHTTVNTHKVKYNVQATAESPNNFRANPNGKFIGTVALRDAMNQEVDGFPDRSDVILSKHQHLDRAQEMQLDAMGFGYNQTPAGNNRTGISGPTNLSRENTWMGERIQDETQDLGFPGFVYHPTHTDIGAVNQDLQTAENTASAASTHIGELLETLEGDARMEFLNSVRLEVEYLRFMEEINQL